MVLAGGAGKRLSPLTADRAKPAVPFGGIYRLIDFVLSNLVNADYLRIVVLTQYKSHSLDRHISLSWRMSSLLGNYVTPVPAQQRLGPRWFQGSADAIYQSLNLVYDEQPQYVVVYVADGAAQVYDFANNDVPGATDRDRGYWRDVGTIDQYYEAHMDLVSVLPVFNLYNRRWPILTHLPPLPPAKFVHDEPGRTGHAIESLVSPGCIVSGGEVRQSVLSPGVHVHSRAVVEGSVLLNGVDVGRGARLRRVIVDKGVVVPPGARIGVDHEEERAGGFRVREAGVGGLAKGEQ